MVFYYTHRSVPFSAIIRETSSLSDGNKGSYPKSDIMQKVKDLGGFHWEIFADLERSVWKRISQ